MPETSFNNLMWVAAIALVAPFVVASLPRLRIPAVVAEIVGGIALGPSGLGWVEADLAVEIVALLGLSFLLFVGGTEVDPARLRGATVRIAGLGYVISIVLAVAVGGAVVGLGLASSPLLVAVALSATSLGVIIAVLTDAGRTGDAFGQQLITNASVADFGAVLLLSMIFAQSDSSVGARLVLLAGLVLLAVVAAVALSRAQNVMSFSSLWMRLEGGAVEIQVRLAIVLMLSFAVAALQVGVEAILGSFLAGAILSFVARDAMVETRLHHKLGAVGYGFLIPAFFVTAGLRFDLGALREGSALIAIPVFVIALLVVRGLPALLTLRGTGRRTAMAMALLQATSLSFLVTATQIGLMAGLIDPAPASALVAAGLVSVAVFPPAALALLEAEARSAPPIPVTELGEERRLRLRGQ
jgi:Kef-type K+ transport system membrane component KefB